MTREDLVKFVNLYNEERIKVIRSFPVLRVAQFCDLVIRAYDNGGTIYFAANGGNAGLLDNFAVDLAFHPFVSDDKTKPAVRDDAPRMKVVNLTASPSVLTGLMNDFGPEKIFTQQLVGRVKEGDIFVGVSGSGNSVNIVSALEYAKAQGAYTVAFAKGNGGKVREIAHLPIVIPGTSDFPGQRGGNDNNFHFEDCLCSISHMVSGLLQGHVREKHGL